MSNLAPPNPKILEALLEQATSVVKYDINVQKVIAEFLADFAEFQEDMGDTLECTEVLIERLHAAGYRIV